MTHRPLVGTLAAALCAGLAAPAAMAQQAPGACSDFHGHANAAWMAAHPLTAGSEEVSALGQLQANARQQQIALLDQSMRAPENEVQKLLGDFWASGVAEAQVERDGAQPLAPLLERITAIRRSSHVAPAIAALHQVGIPVAFNFGADVDLRDLDRHIGYFSQGGLGLPGPGYYTRDDDGARALLGQYEAYVRRILALTGVRERDLEEQARLVIDLERRIAAASRPPSALADPTGRYATVATANVTRQYPHLHLDEFLKVQGVDSDTVSMANPQLFATLDALVDDLKPAQWRAYLRWRVGDAMAPYLASAWRDAHFDFHGRILAGREAPPPRQQQVLDAINLAAGPMLGREYAARYLDPESRARAGELAGQVRQSLAAALQRDPRLGPAAKAEAAAKIAALDIELGTPARDLDYTVQPIGRGSFGGNMLIASTWRHREEMRRIGEANVARRWNVLPQQPALAYDVSQNRLIITAAALQPPLFDPAGSAADQFGSFGALVGHELSHGFDGAGRQVDAAGQLRDWWGPAEAATWDRLAGRVVAQYGSFEHPVLEGRTVNATRNRAENIADIAGVQLAWDAYTDAQPDDADDARKDFYRAWAGLWANRTGEVAAAASLGDAHAPGQWRGNGPLMNLAAFGDAYGCSLDTLMELPPAERIVLWPEG